MSEKIYTFPNIEQQKTMTEEEFDKWADIVVERHNTIAEAYENCDYRRVQAELAGLGDHLSPLPLIMFLLDSPNQFKKTTKEEVKNKYAYMVNPELFEKYRDAIIEEVMGDLGVKEV